MIVVMATTLVACNVREEKRNGGTDVGGL